MSILPYYKIILDIDDALFFHSSENDLLKDVLKFGADPKNYDIIPVKKRKERDFSVMVEQW